MDVDAIHTLRNVINRYVEGGCTAWADLGNLHQGGRAGSVGGQGGHVDTSAVGASRGKRGAEGAEGVGLGEGVSPPQWPCPLSRKFLNF